MSGWLRATPHPATEVAISAEHLMRTFGQFTAVNDVSFEVKRGEIFGFLGPNGSGKTTVIKMLTGLLPLTAARRKSKGSTFAPTRKKCASASATCRRSSASTTI